MNTSTTYKILNSTKIFFAALFAKAVFTPKGGKSSFLVRWGVVAIAFLFIAQLGMAQTIGDYRTRYTNTTVRDWNTATNWQIYNGSSWITASAVPSSSTNVTIQNGSRYSISATSSCSSLTISGGGTITYVSITGFSLTVTGALTINAPTAAVAKYIAVGTGTLTAGSITMATTGNDSYDSYITVSTGTITVNGNITMNGAAARNQIVFTGAGMLNVDVTGTITGGTISNATGGYTALTRGTVNYNGTAQTVGNYIYYNLTLSGSNTKTLQTGTTSITGNLTLSGTASTTTVVGLTIGGSLNIGDGTTFTTGAYNLTVTGTTTVGDGTSGTITIGSYNGTKIFTGLLTISSGGTWDNSVNSPVTFRGGITNNGTFTPGSAYTYTFDTNAQSLNGTINMAGSTVVVTGINLTNYGTLTFGSALNGTGTLTNSSTGNLNIEGSGYINITTLNNQGTFTITSTGGFGTAAATFTNTGTINLNGSGYLTGMTNNAGGTVNFTNASHTIGTFNNATSTSVLNISALITSASAINTLTTTTTGNTVNYSGSGAQTVKNVTYSNLTISGSGTKTMSGATTVTGTLTLTSGILSTTLTNLLSVTNTATSAISGGSATAYIDGPVKRTLPTLTSGSTYFFPVGKSGAYKPFSLVNPTTTGTITAQVEAFAASSGGSPESALDSISVVDYWQLTKSGSFTNTSVSLERTTAIYPLNVIAVSTTVGGTYTSYYGTVGTFGVSNSNTVTIGATNSWFFVLGRVKPKITVSTTTLSGLTYAENNGPSTEQLFTVSGSGLSENINLSLPVNSHYELSTTSGGTFTRSVNALLNNDGSATVSTTTIYVRLKAGLTVGTYNDATNDVITASSLGATSKTVTCTGNVTDQPLITVTPSALTGLSYVLGSGPSTAQTFSVTGANLQSNITVTAPADFEISQTSATSGYSSTTLTLIQSGGNVSKTIWVRLKSGLSTSTYNEDITLAATYAVTKTVNCQGAVNRATINISKLTLAGFIYTYNAGPSDVQSFNVSGTTLSASIVITAPTDFEVSTSFGGTYGSSVSLPQSGGVVNSTAIYVRMKSGHAVGIITAENISLTSANAITQTVACSGAVVSGAATISSKPTLNGFFYIVGNGPSVTQSFTVSGTSLTSDITVTAPTDFEISSSGTDGTFGGSFTITPSSGKVNASPVYIRLKSTLSIGTYNETVTLSATGTTPVSVASNGKVVAQPTIVAGPSNPLSACEGSSVTLTSSGTNIDNQTWTGPNNFYSTDVNPNLGTVSTTNSGDYTVTGNVSSGVNLITNGDFESGNTGFGSTYTYVNGQITYGQYTIVSNADDADPTYFLTAYDHTNPNTGKQMVLDGSTSTGEIVWAQTVSVNSNAAYQFIFWAQNIADQVSTSYGELQLYVNNVPVGDLNTIETKGWVKFLSSVNSGSNTSLQLTLINFNQNGAANDFALDDIDFEQVFQVSDTLALTVNPMVTPSVTIVASANPSTTGASVTFTATPTNGGTSPAYAWYVGSTLQVGITGSTFSYVPTNGDQVRCELTSSLTCTTTNPVNSTTTITMIVQPATNYWIGTTDTDWAKTSNWTGGYLPVPGADVIFATVANYGSIAVNDLVLDVDRTQGNLINQTTKNLIIPAGKSLTLNSTITTDNSVDRIYIQSSSTGANGSLIFYDSNPVYGTVEMYSKATWSSTGVVDPATLIEYHYNWQYFGIPITTVRAEPTFYGSYVRRWVESGDSITNHWLSIGNDYYLEPFKGYEITQQVTTGKTIVFQGQLVNSNYTSTNPLTITSTALFPGQYIFANPYTAAIDIRQLTLGSGTDGSVYLYNTGSFGAWVGIDGAYPLDGTTYNPGQYVAVPIENAGYSQLPRQVPSMGAMLIRPSSTTTNVNYNFSINYNAVIMKNTDIQRVSKADTTGSSNKVGMIIDVNGAHAADRMWLFSEPTSTRGFDKGWDGQKIIGSALTPQLYSIEKDGNYQVNTLPDMNGTELAFQAGQDVEDTLTFTNMNLEKQYAGVYLVDLLENRTIDITTSGTQYAFMAESTPTPVTRFKIVTRPYEKNAPDAETQVKVFSAGNSIYVQNVGSADGECRVYDIAGHYLMKVPFSSNNVTTITNSLRPGAYIATAIAGGEKVSKRLIVQ